MNEGTSTADTTGAGASEQPALRFRRIESAEPVVDYISKALNDAVAAGKQVLWLVSGGSAIDIAVRVARQLEPATAERLIVTLADERYGPVGHTDSNWAQLERVGFSLLAAERLPVLVGLPFTETVRRFDQLLDGAFHRATYSLALLGMGEDGHTAGILPHSEAVHSSELVCGYHTGRFDRITISAPALSRLDEGVVYAMGPAKRPELEKLQQSSTPVDEQPSQALKVIPLVTIFNDQIGDSV